MDYKVHLTVWMAQCGYKQIYETEQYDDDVAVNDVKKKRGGKGIRTLNMARRQRNTHFKIINLM